MTLDDDSRLLTVGIAYKRRQLGRVPNFEMLSEDNIREGFVTAAEFEAFAKHVPPVIRDMARFSFLCGWRKGAIAKLEWRDVEFSGNEPTGLWLRRKNSKNRKPLFLPLQGELQELIRRRLEARKVQSPDAHFYLATHVFHRDGRPVRDFTYAWNKAREKAGMPDLLFHDLRRTGARDLIRSGVDETVAMRIIGHATRSMFTRYNITSDDDIREAMEARERYAKGAKEGQRIVEGPRG